MLHEPSHYNFKGKYPRLRELYQKQKKSHWIPEEVDLTKDKQDWAKFGKDEKRLIKLVLGFFAQFDGIVCENLVENFQRETAAYAKEIGWFYAAQNAIEVIHNEMYTNLIENLIPCQKKQEKVLDAISNFPSIKKMAEWVEKWMNPSIPLPERIIAFAALEGVIFTGAFAVVYYFTTQGVLPGLATANSWISRDEALHTDFAVALYRHLTEVDVQFERVSPERCREILASAVEAKREFISDSLRLDTVRISASKMMGYVERACDSLSTSLGYDKIYFSASSLDYMLMIGLQQKANFFETVVTEYSKGLDMGDGSFKKTEKF